MSLFDPNPELLPPEIRTLLLLRQVLTPVAPYINRAYQFVQGAPPPSPQEIQKREEQAKTAGLAIPETMRMWVLDDYKSLEGKVIGTGQCAAICQGPGRLPLTREWVEGPLVKGNAAIPAGTVIATFVNGRYPNRSHGNHVAIYDSQTAEGLLVLDQWTGQPAHYRLIIFDDTRDDSNNGNRFSVVLTRKAVVNPR